MLRPFSKLSGPRCWRWASPSASERDLHRDSGSDAAKYPAISRSGKDKSCGGNPPVATAQTFPPGRSNPLLTSVHWSASFIDRNTLPTAPAKM